VLEKGEFPLFYSEFGKKKTLVENFILLNYK